MGKNMTYDEIENMIKFHEGFRGQLYLDSIGNLTGGWGHYFYEGSPLPEPAAEVLFNLDYAQARLDYEKLHLNLDSVRRAVIVDMLFNMGIAKVLKFKNMLACIRARDYVGASEEMLDSRWAGQVKTRAVRLARMMKTGDYEKVFDIMGAD